MTKKQFFSFCSLCGQPLMEGETLTVTPERIIVHKQCYQQQHDAEAAHLKSSSVSSEEKDQLRRDLKSFTDSMREAY